MQLFKRPEWSQPQEEKNINIISSSAYVSSKWVGILRAVTKKILRTCTLGLNFSAGSDPFSLQVSELGIYIKYGTYVKKIRTERLQQTHLYVKFCTTGSRSFWTTGAMIVLLRRNVLKHPEYCSRKFKLVLVVLNAVCSKEKCAI
jgi:hypothetical protein